MNSLRRLSRRLPLLCLLALPLCAVSSPAFSAAPAPDQIVGLDDGFDPGANGAIDLLVSQADGKLLVAGGFDYIGGGQALGLARLRVDGRLDPTFQVDLNGPVSAMLPLDDGRVLIAGYFSKVDGIPRYGFAALEANGRLDQDYDLDLGSIASAIVRQPDGGILLIGAGTGLMRLDAQGRLDADFVPFFAQEGWYGSVYSAAAQPDGRIVLAGYFEPSDGSTPLAFARVNPDGSLDASFQQPSDEDAQALAFSVQRLVALGDGSLVGAGPFELPDHGSGKQTGLLKLHPDGGLDADFRPDPNAAVKSIAVQPDGRILVAGTFSQVGGVQRLRVARLNADGSLDAGFAADASAPAHTIAVLADGKIALGGEFTRVGGRSRQRIARLETDGRVETAFVAGADPIYSGVDSTPRCLVQLPDQQLLIGCGFSYVGTTRAGMARLHADGSIDASFVAPTIEPGFSNAVDVISPQPDGKFLIGGHFTKVNGVERPGLARLNADGSLDIGFTPPNWAGSGEPWARAVALQPDGRIVVSGLRVVTNPYEHQPTITRLNADGSIDASFHAPTLDNPVEPLQVLPGGKILLAGYFGSIDGTPCRGIARLNADGTLDATFVSPFQDFGVVNILQPLPSGKILIAGYLSIDGATQYLARLNADGSLDRSFSPATPNDAVQSLVLAADGSIALGGKFTRIGGETRRYLARLRPDGSLDPDFQPAVAEWIFAMAQLADGKLLVAGDFTSIDGLSRSHLARLPAAAGASRHLGVDAAGTLRWTLGGASPVATEVRFDLSLDGDTWTPLGQGQPSANGWRYAAGAALPRDTGFWVRAQGRTGSREGAVGNGSVSLLESTLFARLSDAAVYTLTPQSGAGGRLDPAKPVTVYAGEVRRFDVLVEAGYVVDSVSGCGGSLSGSVYTTAPVGADCTVVASFRSDGGDRLFADGFDAAAR
ncbi:hypothetical protein [Dokdonella sp.]|uniref:hypothetical protein n=1 Tax=Dokdonella sp. TaxID=2291710 RepID=UPI001B134CD7|nr:hypothetical protein [Dokdonella sp.]MBO9661361.1 delta-60 repeat domain-containing protein [Dokdonella sp.]